jgi:hypothetical protein
MKITTIDNGRYSATFNRRQLLITGQRSLKAVDTETGEILDGPELTSIKSLVKWHLAANRQTSELNTYQYPRIYLFCLWIAVPVKATGVIVAITGAFYEFFLVIIWICHANVARPAYGKRLVPRPL